MENFQNEDGLGTHEQENTAKPKICFWATLSSICFFCSVFLYFSLMIVFEGLEIGDKGVGKGIFIAIIVLVVASFLASPVFAIVALIKISVADNLGGKGRAGLTLAGVCFIGVFMAGAIGAAGVKPLAYRLMCGTNLGGLGKAMAVYSSDYDGKLPTASLWCDLLVVKADVSTGQFVCHSVDIRRNESSYAMNRAAANKKLDDLPNDLVVLFETNYGRTAEGRNFRSKERWYACQPGFDTEDTFIYKDRWNQVGGPEILSIENHENGCNILFADGHVSYETTKTIPQLRWVINDSNFVFPMQVLRLQIKTYSWRLPVLCVIVGFVVLALGVIAVKYKIWMMAVSSLIIGLLAAGLGALFGAGGEMFYRPEDWKGIGVWAGLALGLLFGAAFVPFIKKMAERFAVKQIRIYTVAIGMIVGVLCSTLFHGVLMIAYVDPTPVGMIAGIPFGIISGAILGFIAGVVLQRKRKQAEIQ